MFIVGLLVVGCAEKESTSIDSVQTAPQNTKLAAYFHVSYAPVSSIREKLEAAGFTTVVIYAPTDTTKIVVITTQQMVQLAGNQGRGFAGVLHVLVDQEKKRVIYTNPVYFAKAFLQSDYNRSTALVMVNKLKDALGEPVPIGAMSDSLELPSYQFMVGMPKYGNVDLLAEGNASALLSKLQNYEYGDKVVFRLDLGESKMLIGYDLSPRAKSIIAATDMLAAGILPYTILIEDGKAKALSALYTIPLSWPQITMNELMDLAILPGEIKKNLQVPFQ